MTRTNLDKLEATALTATVADLILTVMLYGSNFATEQNGVAELLIKELGWMPAAILGVSVVGLCFVGIRRRIKPHYPRIAVGTGGLITAISAAPVANNLSVLHQTGLPDGLPMVTGEVALVASVAAVVLYAKPDPRPALQRVGETAPRPDGRQVATVAFTLMLVTSGVGGLVQFGVDEAEAAEGEGVVWNTTPDAVNAYTQTSDSELVVGGDGVVTAYDSSGSEAWSYNLSIIVTSLAETDDGNIVIGASNGDVFEIDPDTGEEQWRYTPHGSDARIDDVVVTSDGWVVTASSSIIATDPSDGSEQWSVSPSEEPDFLTTTPNGRVAAAGGIGHVAGYDDGTGSQEWTHSLHGSTAMNVIEATDDGLIITQGNDENVRAYDPSSDSEVWSYNPSTSDVDALTVTEDGLIVTGGSSDNTIRAHDPSSGSEEWSYSPADDGDTGVNALSQTDQGHIAILSSSGSSLKAYDYGYDPSEPVTGQVVDQTGAPVSNATVEVWAASSSVGSVSEQQFELDQISDPTPSAFDSSLDVRGNVLEGADGDVPLVYTESEIGATARTDTPSMSEPNVQVPAGEPFAIALWNPSASSGMLSFVDGYASQLPGEPSSGEVTVERLGPSGDTTDTMTVETDEAIESDVLAGSTRLEFAEVTLTPGYYRVTAESSGVSYIVQVGSGQEILDVVRDDIEDTNEQLSERAKEVQQALDNQRIYRTTVETGPDGQFSASVPSNAGVVQVQAYSAGGLLDDVSTENRSIAQAKELASSSDYTGKWYFSPTPTRAEAPAENMEVTVVGFDSAPGTSMEEVMSQFDSWEEFMSSEYSDSKLADLVEQRIEDVGRDRLEKLHGELMPVIESNSMLMESAREINGGEFKSASDASREELTSQIDAMEQALSTMEPTNVVEDSNVEWNDDGTVDYSFDVGSGVTDILSGVDSYSVLAVSPDGSTEPVPDEYVSTDGSTVSVEGYPVPEGEPGVKFRVVADSSEGVVQDAVRSTNPSFSGDVPALESISVNSNVPQVGETVQMELTPEDEFTYGQVESVSVYGPDGEVSDASVVDSETVRFSPSAAGEYDSRITYSNSDGTTFTESVTLQAEENAKTTPPSVRIVDGTNSRYALASGVEAAEIETVSEGSSIDVTAQLERGEIPSEIDIYAGSVVGGPQQDINVQLVEGPEQSAVSQQVTVQVHTAEIGGEPSPWSDGAVVERIAGEDGEPIPRAGGAAGDVDAKKDAGATITTYTGENGGVTVSVNNDPGLVERMSFWASQQLPDIGLPFGAVSAGDVSTDGLGGVAIGGIGLAGLFSRRRAS